MQRPIEMFCSYAHEDEALVGDLRSQLVVYDRQHAIRWWHDREIPAGKAFAGEIDTHLERADIVLLCVSPDFFGSDYCYDVEMTEALRRHESGCARVIPIILRPCGWESAPFAHLAALPTDGKPVTRWDDRDEASLNVAEGVMAVVRELAARDRPAEPSRGATGAEPAGPVPATGQPLPPTTAADPQLADVRCTSPHCRSEHVVLTEAVRVTSLTAEADGWIAHGTLQVEYDVDGHCQMCGRLFDVARRAIPVQFPDLVCHACGRNSHLEYRVQHLIQVAGGYEFAVDVRCAECSGKVTLSRVIRSLLRTVGIDVGLRGIAVTGRA